MKIKIWNSLCIIFYTAFEYSVQILRCYLQSFLKLTLLILTTQALCSMPAVLPVTYYLVARYIIIIVIIDGNVNESAIKIII